MISVAIDGPGGAGKSTAARAAAERTGLKYMDTGAIYRSLGVYLRRSGVDIDREEAVAAALPALDVEVFYNEEGQQIRINGEDMLPYIRTPEAGDAASRTSAYGCVRDKLLQLQRDTAERYSVIMDGRDIGTVVLPNADLKIYITADPQERGRRRFLELWERGRRDITLEGVTEEIRQRDERDRNRPIAPLRRAEDARLLDTTNRSPEEVTELICTWIREKEAER